MNLFSLSWWFRRQRRLRREHRASPPSPRRRSTPLQLDLLEDRSLLDCSVISGHVFDDVNGNGLFGPGDRPIANSPIVLRNSAGGVVGTTVTDANGHYRFRTDSTISTAPTTTTRTVSFDVAATDWSQTRAVAQFNPTLGRLTAVEIVADGTVTSTIRVENVSTSSASTATATVSGTLTLTGPGIPTGLMLTPMANAGTFNATAYDGTMDFGGTSGHNFGTQTARDSGSLRLTDPAVLALYTGTSSVNLTETATATSRATGGGNLVSHITTTAAGQTRVIYHYIPNNCLRDGNYTVSQPVQPAGYLDGPESAGGVVLPNPIGTDVIAVWLRGRDSTGNNFAEIRPAGLSGFVYLDRNNNGAREAGEPGIAGVTVTLTGTSDVGAVNAVRVTAADGSYAFTNWRPGTYTLTETHPASYLDGLDTVGSAGGTAANDRFTNITLTPGLLGTNYNFGELLPSSLSGYVFADLNNNGVKDPGEAGIANVLVTLSGADDRGTLVNVPQTTDPQGAFHFAGLRPGTYTLTEAQPAGYLDGRDSAGTAGGSAGNDRISTIVLPMGTDGSNYVFGELPPSSLSGFVYVDRNNNGVKDPGEPGIADATVLLTGVDDTGPVRTTATTAADGAYRFAGIRAGTYALTESQPLGYLDGADTSGSLGGLLGSDQVRSIPVGWGVTGFNYNFGELAPAGLSGYVYVDLNNDGIRQDDEPGLRGVAVLLTGVDDLGTVRTTAQTNADGLYLFPGLRPGTYTLTETQPEGYLDGKERVGSAGGAAGPDQVRTIVLAMGTIGTHYDFGELIPSDLGGQVYVDANNNGVRDPGEAGIADVALTLVGTNDLGPVTLTAGTNSDGAYRFVNLRPGTYTLTEVQPIGFLDGLDRVGTSGGVLAPDQVSDIQIGVRVGATGYDFGELVPAELSGFVYVDANNNGSKDPGEPGIAGAIVTLSGTGDRAPVLQATQTGSDGSYAFTNLRPGTYTLTETQPSGYLDGQDAVGSAGGTLGADQVTTIGLASGVRGTNYNFGELLPASLSGFAYVDANNNGVRDVGEFGIPGATITLTGTSDRGTAINQTRTTASDGSYQFGDLRPGTYTLVETQPPGYVDGSDTVGSAGGTLGNDRISDIPLGQGVQGVHYNFGEIPTPGLILPVVGRRYTPPRYLPFATPDQLPVQSKQLLLSTPRQPTLQGGALLAQALFIDNVYRALLRRPVDGNALDFWMQMFRAGLARQPFVHLIWISAEHRAIQVEDYVQVFLGRPSTANDRAYWGNLFQAGYSENDVIRLMLVSPEYLAGHASEPAYIQGLYNDLLQRGASTSEVSYWTGRLQSGLTRDAMAQLILTSPEATEKRIDFDYTYFLQRPMAAASRQFWTTLVATNRVTIAWAGESFLASDEFYAYAVAASAV